MPSFPSRTSWFYEALAAVGLFAGCTDEPGDERLLYPPGDPTTQTPEELARLSHLSQLS